MKFKLVENYDQTRDFVQEYAYEVIDELGNASLEEYIQWFMSEFTYFDDEVKQAVKDFYIEAIDCGKIDLPKTMITSELTTYLEANVDLIDKDIDALIDNCPDHLKYELNIVLSKLNESLNESVLEEDVRPDLKRFIEQHAELLDENNIEELYKQCPRELKIPLVRMLNAAALSDNIESIKRATFLADFYDDEELINLVLSVGEHANDVFDAFDYIMNNWNEFFTDDVLNEGLLTEKTDAHKEVSIHAFSDANNKPYKLSGIKSKIIDTYSEPLKLLCINLKNNDIPEGEALFADICNNDQEDPWTTHHINGLHKNSSIRDLSNLALIRRSLHKELTDKNKIIAERCLDGLSITGNTDVDKLICRLLVVLYNQDSETRINPSQIFRISIRNADNLMNDVIPDTVSKEFYNLYDRSTSDVIRLIDLKNFKT